MGLNAQIRRERRRYENSNKVTQDGRPVVSQVTARFVRSSQRKVAIVADLIRNKPVIEALEVLKFTHRPSGVPHIEKALHSAIANATDLVADPYDLVVAEIRVEGGPMLKRIRPASMGRAVRVRKRLAHLHISLTER